MRDGVVLAQAASSSRRVFPFLFGQEPQVEVVLFLEPAPACCLPRVTRVRG
jgi:hypothetical protein